MLKKEILFLWDGENFNPNGDMLNSNAPRIDEETNIAEATDVRIKRTIRDELMRENEDQIFVKEYRRDENILDCKNAIRQNIDIKKSKNEVIEQILTKFIDIRAFGGVLPISDKEEMKKNKDIKVAGVSFTGPVQFRMSKSLHKVQLKHIKGTGAFASGEDKDAKTFREEDFLAYAFFATYGIIDNHNANKTKFSENDAAKIIKALWSGTKNLTTRTKIGQMPRFMLIVSYKDDTYAGDLNNSVELIMKKDDEAIRNLNDFSINFDRLNAKLKSYSDNIEKIEYIADSEFEALNKNAIDDSWIKLKS
ncbi:CRISPR/Cas system-associated RAMP protein Cas7, type I-B/HMARI [Campylobacter iguaniorum]|uniref:CRISPR/Cas system-associated RAMP protein Cas7, type I-B/HMARI n=1 Tax=Campylobacter iguaniorum TaxID=1244531 RepID=A0A076F8A6_9BACT|nr:type I-B CRISPR-associated protein Cas7/Csh2 [Campylobacter iguaniorum]AII14450.1 CRISPR/Cas system-associated RAMP protein Cas7, type I-B/HMARI [Campylobacter iguaniorum]ALV24185.1 CRISPR/Cas system-associated RAMP protein Cas7, type I-B/HMARI [Campylobacter iguaniorum]